MTAREAHLIDKIIERERPDPEWCESCGESHSSLIAYPMFHGDQTYKIWICTDCMNSDEYPIKHMEI